MPLKSYKICSKIFEHGIDPPPFWTMFKKTADLVKEGTPYNLNSISLIKGDNVLFSAHLCKYIYECVWTSLLSKALSLSINCNILKLFPQGSRHRSHHTQKVVPNVVARHQLLNTSPDNGIFPIKYMSRLMRKKSSLFSKNQNRFIH